MNLETKKPFHDQYRFRGRVVSSAGQTPPLDVLIDCDSLTGSEIAGSIIGDDTVARQCDEVSGVDELCRIVGEDDYGKSIEVEGVIFRNVYVGFSAPLTVNTAVRTVADIQCERVTQRESDKRADDNTRSLCFMLDGPIGAWLAVESSLRSWKGDRTVTTVHAEVNVGVETPFKVELRNHYYWEGQGDHGSFAPVPALLLTSLAPADELSDEQFEAMGRQFAEDIILFLSFVTRGRIGWYQLRARLSTRRMSERRLAVHGSRERRRIDDTPVGSRPREFVQKCFAQYQRLRADKYDLRLPILYSVPAGRSRFVEEQFAASFWALEKLVDLFAHRDGRDRLVRTAQFEKIQDALRAILDPLSIPDQIWGDTTSVIKEIKNKLSDLNRPAFASLLQWMCDKYQVEWRDLYPSDAVMDSPRFIRTRNEVFHSHKPIDGAFIVRETMRVRAVFERLVLRVLDWEELSYTKPRELARPIDAVL